MILESHWVLAPGCDRKSDAILSKLLFPLILQNPHPQKGNIQLPNGTVVKIKDFTAQGLALGTYHVAFNLHPKKTNIGSADINKMLESTVYKNVNKPVKTVVEMYSNQLRKMEPEYYRKRIMDSGTFIRVTKKSVLSIIQSLTLYES